MTDLERAQHRNDVIEEMCNWLEGCIALVDHKSETYQSCSAMVAGMRNKKTAEPDADPGRIVGKLIEGQRYPLTHKP